MTDKQEMAMGLAMAAACKLAQAADESTVLAITASYMAGKEAGKREALENGRANKKGGTNG